MNKDPRRPAVILIDDDDDMRRAAEQSLRLADIEVSSFHSPATALPHLDAGFIGVVVSDLRMPRMDGFDLFERVRAIDPDIPVIFITGHGDIADAVQALKSGAYDFIAKPFPAERLIASVSRALDQRGLVLEHRRLLAAANAGAPDSPILGVAPAIVEARQSIARLADTDVDVLIEGETGVGKELAARTLHAQSRRRRNIFVTLHCAATSDATLISDLFGEARRRPGELGPKTGIVEAASNSTLFLDDIDRASPALQACLAQLLEERMIAPLGADEPRPITFRAVASAGVDLRARVQAGAFRADLFYALSTFRIALPPLRERREDTGLLFATFLSQAASQLRRAPPPLSESVRRMLCDHAWPGNIRELRHYAERVALGAVDPFTTSSEDRTGLPEQVERFEASIIRQALSECEGDVRAALELLKIPRKTFYDKLKRHGIDINAFRKNTD
jgi:two-component system C4-dicarboxylate transport response regulator DctD